MKKHLRKQVLFQLNPPPAEEIHLRWMKSLRDEIPLRGNKGGGFDFICEADFIRAYICEANCSDFIVLRTISLRTYELHFCTLTPHSRNPNPMPIVEGFGFLYVFIENVCSVICDTGGGL